MPVRETILLLDDSKDSLIAITAVLESRGYGVLVARSAAEAMFLARENRNILRLFLADVILPAHGSGYDVAQQVRSICDVPALLISGAPIEELVRQGYLPAAASQDPFLLKPFPPAALLERVRELLDAARLPRPA